MKQKLISLLTLLLCVCSGAWGQDPDFELDDFNTQGFSNVLKTFTDDGITLAANGDGKAITSFSNSCIQLGNGANSYNNYFFGIKADRVINKVQFHVTSNSNSNIIQPALVGWTSEASSEVDFVKDDVSKGSWSGSNYAAAQWIEYDLSGNNLKEVRLYRNISGGFTIDGNDMGTKGQNKTVRIYGVKVWLAPATPSLVGAWSKSSDTFYQGDDTPDVPTFDVTASDETVLRGTEYEVVYSSSDNDIVEVTSAGVVTLKNTKIGTATVTATLTSTDESAYITPTTNSFVYTVKVKEKLPTITLSEDEITLKSTPVTRAASTTVNLTGVFLKTGTGSVTWSDVDGLTISPTAFTVDASGNASESFTITYNKDVATSGSVDVTFSDGTNKKVLTVNYSSVVAHEWATVSTATTWDWTTVSGTVALTDDTTNPAKGADSPIVAADFDGECHPQNAEWPNTFNAAALKMNKFEYANRGTNHYFQGHIIQIQTSVPGTIQVWYSNTSKKDVERFIDINGTQYGNADGGAGSKDATIISTTAVYVAAGVITLTGMEGEVSNYVHIQKIVFTPLEGTTAKISHNYATFSNNNACALEVPEGVTAFGVSANGTDHVTLAKYDVIPANTGVILYSESKIAVEFEGTNTSSTYEAANLMVPVANDTNVPENSYVLAWDNNNSKVVFAKVTSTTATLNKGQAYLTVPAAARFNTLFLDEDSETTGISSVTSEADNRFYNLRGQRVAQPQKGLYIVNGKKVVIK